MVKQRLFPLLTGVCLVCFLSASSFAAAAPVADFSELAKSAIPAVVNISTERTEQGQPFGNPFDFFRGHPDMDRFFGPFEDFYNQMPRSRKTSSLGSGFIISPDGYIVTNNHVVEGADVIRVNIGGKNKKDELHTAEVVGTDKETDLALLKIKADDLPYLKFGSSDTLDVGEWVVAIGSPLGLDHTVTAGIVSAKGRNIQSGSYDDYLQTDASINRGNSGGPLLNMKGEVIGINTAIAQRAQGIGFAIPSTLAQRIIGNLKDYKGVRRGWLGVTIQNIDEATAKALALKDSRGALVNSVLEGQPAALAGIRDGDVILAVNGQAVEDTGQLLRAVELLTPGSKAEITVWRDGKEEKISLTVAERDRTQAQGRNNEQDLTGADALLGMKVRPVNADDIRRFNLRNNSGLLVTGLDSAGLAAEAGIKAGDIVLAVNKQPVSSAKDLAAKIAASGKERGAVLLHIWRDGQLFFRAVEIRKK